MYKTNATHTQDKYKTYLSHSMQYCLQHMAKSLLLPSVTDQANVEQQPPQQLLAAYIN